MSVSRGALAWVKIDYTTYLPTYGNPLSTASEAAIRRLKASHGALLMRIRGVCGVGIEHQESGKGCVLAVHLSDDRPEVRAAVRAQLGDIPVKLIASGPFQKLSAAKPELESRKTTKHRSGVFSPQDHRSRT